MENEYICEGCGYAISSALFDKLETTFCPECGENINEAGISINQRNKGKRVEYANTPADQARSARKAGARTFQISLPLSQTRGSAVPLIGAFTHSTDTQHATTIDSIEAEGWHLEHVGYVYRVTGSVSRDKLLSSGQQEAVHGEIVGIYIFRVTEISTNPQPEGRNEPANCAE